MFGVFFNRINPTIDGFLAKLRGALLLDEQAPILDLRGQDLSLDSLIGVDLRSWFEGGQG